MEADGRYWGVLHIIRIILFAKFCFKYMHVNIYWARSNMFSLMWISQNSLRSANYGPKPYLAYRLYLNLSKLLLQHTVNQVAHQQQKFSPHNSGGWEVQDQALADQCLMGALSQRSEIFTLWLFIVDVCRPLVLSDTRDLLA